MELHIKDLAWPDDMVEYFFLPEVKKAICHKAYKQVVVARMLIMGSNNDQFQKELEQHIKMSSDKKSAYPTTIAAAMAHLLTYKTPKRKKGNRQGTQNDNYASDTEGQEEGKTLLAVRVSPDSVCSNNDNNFEQDSINTQQEEVYSDP